MYSNIEIYIPQFPPSISDKKIYPKNSEPNFGPMDSSLMDNSCTFF